MTRYSGIPSCLTTLVALLLGAVIPAAVTFGARVISNYFELGWPIRIITVTSAISVWITLGIFLAVEHRANKARMRSIGSTIIYDPPHRY